jgi:hypothetical protein
MERGMKTFDAWCAETADRIAARECSNDQQASRLTSKAGYEGHCHNCVNGTYAIASDGGCSCHVRAPCVSCEDSTLECTECGFQPD